MTSTPSLDSIDSIHQLAVSLTQQVKADRRHLHRHPELGFLEHETAAYVAERLQKLGVETTTGVAQTGVVGLIRGTTAGECVLLRADMDALPLEEETGVAYASVRPGVMHACGHDGHTAILLNVAEVLMRQQDRLRGVVKLVFQPAEEGPGGAKPMIEAGVLSSPPVSACFGLHLSNNQSTGTLVVQGGPLQASADEFELLIEGVGGHGAAPHQTVDAVAIGAAVVGELQRIVSREIDPLEAAVITVGSFHSGTRHNIIAGRAELHGTIRALSPAVREFLQRRVVEVATQTAEAARATCTVRVSAMYPVTINDETMAVYARSIAERLVPPEKVIRAKPIMGAEDMSFFLNSVPGCYIFLGSANADRGLTHPHHSPLFDFDEDCLPLGVELLSQLALCYLSEGEA
jgi:amidohydrolase